MVGWGASSHPLFDLLELNEGMGAKSLSLQEGVKLLALFKGTMRLTSMPSV